MSEMTVKKSTLKMGKNKFCCDPTMAILKRTSTFFISHLERFFYWWGCYVAQKPHHVIVGSIIITGLACIGFINLTSESRAEKLWIPPDSPYIKNKAWLDTNFPRNIRTQLAILTSKTNILEPKALLHMLELREKIQSIQAQNSTWNDLCYRIPIADIFLSRRKREADTTQADLTTTTTLPSSKLSFNTPKMVKIGAVINVLPKATTTATTEATTTSTTTAVASEVETVAPSSPNENELAGFELSTSSSTKRLPKLVSTDDLFPDPDDETAAKQFGSIDHADKKLVGQTGSNIWSSDYSEYEEYDLENESLNPQSTVGSDEKEVGSDLPPEIYCDLVNTLNDKCLESSILEIWKYDRKTVEKLTQKDIIDAINTVKESPYFGYKFNFSELLGEISRNSTGHIIGAKSTVYVWSTAFDPTKAVKDEGGSGVELDLADPISLEWEKLAAEVMLAHSTQDITVLANVARSFSDISSKAIFFDGLKMVCGWFLMFVYTMLMLGRFNLVEHRTYLSAAGFIAVGMGLLISLGLTFAIGMPYTPMHAILPFLYLGIGIDDMFVIVQCWYNLQEDEIIGRPLHEKIGLTLQHAGVAITVTSLTDVFAFGVGAVTILPGLQAFCVTCAIGIGSIFLLQASWFVAWMAIDQRRIEARRDGLLPCCLTHKNWTPSSCSQKEICKMGMQILANCLAYISYKIFIIFSTLLFLSIGAWGALQIRQEFDPVLLLPAESYLRQWIDLHEDHWPQNGWVADIYTGTFDPNQDLNHLDSLVQSLQEMSQANKILKSVDAWWPQFKTFIAEEKNITDWRQTISSNNTDDFDNNNTLDDVIDATDRHSFSMLLSDFLFSRRGSKYKNNFHFDGKLICNSPTPNITASQFTITYLPFDGPEEHIPGRKSVEKLIKDLPFSSNAFSFSKVYAAWETDEVIGFELWRNLGLGIGCVFVITIILLADLRICFFVLVCVFLTLVDIVGFLHFWDITIDTLSCINIVLAIGLCVDYSAHIAHAFIVGQGSRLERAQSSLTMMGPAIVNGGITTFLALLLLGFSQSHVFVTFFKVFLLTVVFGLFHGLIFLPVILTILGPTSKDDELSKYESSDVTQTTDNDLVTSSNVDAAKSVSLVAGGGLDNAAFVNENKESMSDVSHEEKKNVRIFGKNGRILAMDESFNPVSSKIAKSSPNFSAKNSDENFYLSATSKNSDLIKKDLFLFRDRASHAGPRSSRYFQDSSISSQSESENEYWSTYYDRTLRNNHSTFKREVELPYSSSSCLARVGSCSPTLASASDHERSLTTYEHLNAVRSSSQNHFDPNFNNTFTHTPIYYIRPAFTKRIPHPKTMSPTQTLITDRDKTYTDGTSTQVTKRDKTDTNDNSNWVLLPASWGPTSKGFLEPVEAAAKSGEAKNPGIGLWVKLKGGHSS